MVGHAMTQIEDHYLTQFYTMSNMAGSTRRPFDGDATMDIRPIKTKSDYRAGTQGS